MAHDRDFGIKATGVYIPRRRIPRAVIVDAHAWALPSLKAMAAGERSLGSWDEDSVTMAVEAARNCQLAADSDALESLTLATTTAPFTSLNNAALVAAALGLPETVRATEANGSTRAGLRALVQGCETQAASELVIGADRRVARAGSVHELLYGHAAAAVLVGPGSDLLARFLGAERNNRIFIDHFRERNAPFDYYWEERWIRDEGVAKLVPAPVTRLLHRLGINAKRVAHFALTGAPPRSDALVAKSLGIPPDSVLPDLGATVGDTGTAHCLLQLAAALERAEPGDVILLASFGQGCEAAVFEAGARPSGRPPAVRNAIAGRIEDRAYGRMLSFEGLLQPDWGMRAETDTKTSLSQLYRAADQILPFVGGKCSGCGAVQFPRLPSCVNCGAVDSQSPHPLSADTAKVVTCTADWLQYTPSPPLQIGLVQFESGARVLMELVDVEGNAVEVGTQLVMRFRIKERDPLRHFNRYFWKAAPVAGGA